VASAELGCECAKRRAWLRLSDPRDLLAVATAAAVVAAADSAQLLGCSSSPKEDRPLLHATTAMHSIVSLFRHF